MPWAVRGKTQPTDLGTGADEDTRRQRRYRAIFISDIHLGTAGCQAVPLLDFLKQHPSDYLYLVGDIVDGWQLRRRLVLATGPQRRGAKAAAPRPQGLPRGVCAGQPRRVCTRLCGPALWWHRSAAKTRCTPPPTARTLWVTHGDYFDGVIQCAKWLAYLGDNAYEFTLRMNRHFNRLRARLGLPYWSLSAYLKGKVKTALQLRHRF